MAEVMPTEGLHYLAVQSNRHASENGVTAGEMLHGFLVQSRLEWVPPKRSSTETIHASKVALFRNEERETAVCHEIRERGFDEV